MQVNLIMPNKTRNYCVFDEKIVNKYVSEKEAALPYLNNVIATSMNEKEVIQALYILDRTIEAGTKGTGQLYPSLARFNETKNPVIQTFLAGIYRKTQVPDAFGPLIKMLFNNIKNPPKADFNPNEEIGGAILEYIQYPKKFDVMA